MPELLVILLFALLIFGPRKLPELGRSLGRSLTEFKRASNELKSTLEEEIRIEEQREKRAASDAGRPGVTATESSIARVDEPRSVDQGA